MPLLLRMLASHISLRGFTCREIWATSERIKFYVNSCLVCQVLCALTLKCVFRGLAHATSLTFAKTNLAHGAGSVAVTAARQSTYDVRTTMN